MEYGSLQLASLLRELTCHMWSHCVNRHLTEGNIPALNPAN